MKNLVFVDEQFLPGFQIPERDGKPARLRAEFPLNLLPELRQGGFRLGKGGKAEQS
ncbi:hypothetical protein GCM10027299_48860 [Larkinella ripae]